MSQISDISISKQAAEKIAHEYYNVGIELALQNSGLTKTANKKNILSGLAGLGAGLGARPAMSKLESLLATNPNEIMKLVEAAPAKGVAAGAAPTEVLSKMFGLNKMQMPSKDAIMEALSKATAQSGSTGAGMLERVPMSGPPSNLGVNIDKLLSRGLDFT